LHATSLNQNFSAADNALVFVVEGWFRGQDANATCHEGYQKRQKTHKENQEGMEARADFDQADRSSNQHP
jgi:hypothetical protein